MSIDVATGAEAPPGLLQRPRAQQEHQPRRGRRLRRRRPSGHPDRRQVRGRAGPAPARRRPTLLGHRDRRRRHDRPHQAQHNHPDQADPDLHHLLRQPAGSADPGVRGRAHHDQGQQPAGQVRAFWHSASATWCATDRGHLRH